MVAELRPGSRNTIAMSTYQLEKSSVTERSFDLIHQLVLNKASIMSRNSSTWTSSYKGKNKYWTASDQHESGWWILTKQVMEAFNPFPRRTDTAGILQKCYNFMVLRLQILYFNTDAHSTVSVVTHASADHSQCSQTAVTVNMISTFHFWMPPSQIDCSWKS